MSSGQNQRTQANHGMLDAYGIEGCGCGRCVHEVISKREGAEAYCYPFIVCADCGNKRCPKAAWHGYKCTRSNEPGQECEVEDGIN